MIPEADCLNTEGQNALLKVLEEPPPYAAFLLMGRNPGAFLPTVRSRCLTLRLGAEAAASGGSDAAAMLAEAFIRGDALAWFKAAFPCEKLDREKFDRLVEELDTAAALRAKAGEGETRARALRLSALTFRLREMRKVNVSPGHCLGWLCTVMNEETGL
jgi:DNA polymerase-3 subunit delta'